MGRRVDYRDLYIQRDKSLLVDIFDKFQDICPEILNLTRIAFPPHQD